MANLNAQKVTQIVRDAGGRIIGRTRLQKIAYLLSAAGLEDGLPFVYKHYGPYSDDLARATRNADLLGLLAETVDRAGWGGTYSTYVAPGEPSEPLARRQLAEAANGADAVALELAATAIFLAKEGYSDPWSETARRKPEKAADGGLERAKELYGRLSAIQTPVPLSVIP